MCEPCQAFATHHRIPSSMHKVVMEKALLLHPLHSRASEVRAVCVWERVLKAARALQAKLELPQCEAAEDVSQQQGAFLNT